MSREGNGHGPDLVAFARAQHHGVHVDAFVYGQRDSGLAWMASWLTGGCRPVWQAHVHALAGAWSEGVIAREQVLEPDQALVGDDLNATIVDASVTAVAAPLRTATLLWQPTSVEGVRGNVHCLGQMYPDQLVELSCWPVATTEEPLLETLQEAVATALERPRAELAVGGLELQLCWGWPGLVDEEVGVLMRGLSDLAKTPDEILIATAREFQLLGAGPLTAMSLIEACRAPWGVVSRIPLVYRVFPGLLTGGRDLIG